MKKLLAALLICTVPAYAQGISSMLPGPGTVHSTGAGAYTGAGNTLSGNTEYWGLDAVTSAARGSNSVQLCDALDAHCENKITDATTGLVLNAATVNGVSCGSITCTAKTIYGQTGAVNMVQNTIANRAVFTPSCVGSLPCLRAAGSACYASSANITVTAQPFTALAVAKRTAAFTTEQVTVGADFAGGPTWVIDFDTSINQAYIYAGASFSAVVSDSTMHTLQAVFNSTSSVLAVDATQNAGNTGTSGTGNAPYFLMCDDASSRKLQGDFLAAGIWGNVGASSGNMTTINTNYHSRWGY